MPVAPLTLVCLSLATLFVAALPVVLYRRLLKPLALDWREVVTGIAVFALFATVIERALNDYVLRGNATTVAWLSHPLAFIVYGALSAGVCEEVGRFIGMQMLRARARHADHAPADSTGFGYGIGHGGAEAWLVGVVVQLQWLLFAVLDNRGELDAHLTNLPAESIVRVHLILANLSPLFAGVFVVERVSALVFQLGFSVLMWRGIRAGWKGALPFVVIVHALVDLPAALYQAHRLPLTVVDGLYAVGACVVAAALFRVYRTGPHAPAVA
ncbi:YhfC family intramembrane metalloprotease [Burkholderia sp. WAC0059]|uniref:YhfC family intramembrane metalloprotease n=1 Tax=Burkholderia sp. WAC0059 TaxID=2066022 RepID=UPI000C7F33BD|nr:YhfC family intramembrane metalloprotease [Burkholderia sp. WAC0059]PLZ03977.1 YhfC family intramembrane metalloprotease [Burkholderia sp. WAC0059]